VKPAAFQLNLFPADPGRRPGNPGARRTRLKRIEREARHRAIQELARWWRSKR
jgi:hypothetical protein